MSINERPLRVVSGGLDLSGCLTECDVWNRVQEQSARQADIVERERLYAEIAACRRVDVRSLREGRHSTKELRAMLATLQTPDGAA